MIEIILECVENILRLIVCYYCFLINNKHIQNEICLYFIMEYFGLQNIFINKLFFLCQFYIFRSSIIYIQAKGTMKLIFVWWIEEKVENEILELVQM